MEDTEVPRENHCTIDSTDYTSHNINAPRTHQQIQMLQSHIMLEDVTRKLIFIKKE